MCESRLTLGVQEVAHGYCVFVVSMNRSILEHLIGVRLGSGSHVLLAEVLDMAVDVGRGKLLGERHLLQRELVDGCTGGAQQRRCGDEGALHDCDRQQQQLSK